MIECGVSKYECNLTHHNRSYIGKLNNILRCNHRLINWLILKYINRSSKSDTKIYLGELRNPFFKEDNKSISFNLLICYYSNHLLIWKFPKLFKIKFKSFSLRKMIKGLHIKSYFCWFVIYIYWQLKLPVSAKKCWIVCLLYFFSF